MVVAMAMLLLMSERKKVSVVLTICSALRLASVTGLSVIDREEHELVLSLNVWAATGVRLLTADRQSGHSISDRRRS